MARAGDGYLANFFSGTEDETDGYPQLSASFLSDAEEVQSSSESSHPYSSLNSDPRFGDGVYAEETKQDPYMVRFLKRCVAKATAVRDVAWEERHLLFMYLVVYFLLSLLRLLNSSWQRVDWHGMLALAIILMEVLLLVSNRVRSSFVFMLGMVLLYTTNIITYEEAFSGFSNSGVVLVASVSMVARALEEANVFRYFFKFVLRQPKSTIAALFRLLPCVGLMSSFLNETTIVGTINRPVKTWCIRCKLPVQQILMPMLFAILLGSTLSLLGCSANIVVSQIASTKGIHFDLFDQSKLGVPLFIMGLAYMLVFAPALLPAELLPPEEKAKKFDTDRMYCAVLTVTEYSSLVGSTYPESGLEVPGARILRVESASGEVRFTEDEESFGDTSMAPGAFSSLYKSTYDTYEKQSWKMYTDKSETLAHKEERERKLRNYLKSSGQHVPTFTSDVDEYNSNAPPDSEDDETVVEFDDSGVENGAERTPSTRRNSHRGRSRTDMHPPLQAGNGGHSQKRGRSFSCENLKRMNNVVDSSSQARSLDTEVVRAGDIIWMLVPLAGLMTVLHFDGVMPATQQTRKLRGAKRRRTIFEAVVSPTSILTTSAVSHNDFRRVYNAAILAVYRPKSNWFIDDAQQFSFSPGDVLLMEGTSVTEKRIRHRHEFSLVSTLKRQQSSSFRGHGIIGVLGTSGLFVAVVVLNAVGLIPLLPGILVLVVVYLALGILTYEQCLDALDADVLFTIAASFATENALDKTNVALALADSLLVLCKPFGELGVMVCVFLTTLGVTSFITNSAAAALMFTISYELARGSGCNVKGVLIVMMFACSASFLTPVAYQSNIIISRRAGYTLRHFLPFGAGLALVDLLVTCILAWQMYPSNGIIDTDTNDSDY